MKTALLWVMLAPAVLFSDTGWVRVEQFEKPDVGWPQSVFVDTLSINYPSENTCRVRVLFLVDFVDIDAITMLMDILIDIEAQSLTVERGVDFSQIGGVHNIPKHDVMWSLYPSFDKEKIFSAVLRFVSENKHHFFRG